jgi:hypothetical protein
LVLVAVAQSLIPVRQLFSGFVLPVASPVPATLAAVHSLMATTRLFVGSGVVSWRALMALRALMELRALMALRVLRALMTLKVAKAELNSRATMTEGEWWAAVKTVVATRRQQARKRSPASWCNKSITGRLVS